MVVKLFFTDGSVSVRVFTDKELNDLNLKNKLDQYIRHLCSRSEAPVDLDSWEMLDNLQCANGHYGNIISFDWREYFNYSNSLVGLELDGKVVDDFEFFEKGSYEYSLGILSDGLDPYERLIKLNYNLDHYHSVFSRFMRQGFDPENWYK